MPKIEVKITNAAEIRRAFSKAPQLTTRYIDAAINLSLFKIRTDSQRQTPVDTGALRARQDIMTRTLYGELEAKMYYAIYVHNGTYKMRARPFLLNAVQTNESYVQDQFIKGMQKVFDQIGSEV